MIPRLLIAAGIAAAAVTSGAPLWALVACVACGVVAAFRPDSVAPAVAALACIGSWAAWGPALSSPLVLAAAAGLVIAHLAAHVASLGPTDIRFSRPAVVRWTARGAILVVLTLAVWACLRLAGHWTPSAAWVLGVLAALAAAAAVFAATRERS